MHARSADIDGRNHGPSNEKFAGFSPKVGQMARYATGLLVVLGLMPVAEACIKASSMELIL